MRRVRCPRCNAVIQAAGDEVKCSHCGLAGRVDGRSSAKPARAAKGDPWTITLDLRKLAPRNWSSGTKAFSVLVLLGLVFAAGGITGAAFERARVDIASDLDEGSNLLSRNGDQAPSNETPYVPPDPVLEPDDGSSSPTPDPDPDPEPDPDPDPEPDPDPDPEPDPAAEHRGITGTGGDIAGPFEMPAGLVELTISYHGDTKFFSVKLHLEVERPELRIDSSDSGSFTGTVRYGSLSQAGQYYIHTNAAEGETWEIDMVVPDGGASGSSFSLTGNGDGGVGPFRFTGSHEVTFNNPSPFSYAVRGFDGEGSSLGCDLTGGSGSLTVTCTVEAETSVYFDIKIKGSDDDWRLSAQGA